MKAPRRPAATVLLVLLLVAALGAALTGPAGCGGNADPFTGLYWEPDTGRRVEIRKEGDDYLLLYGAGRQSYQATRDGDELRVAEPMGGETVVRKGPGEGTLELVTGGKTTLLKPLSQHQ